MEDLRGRGRGREGQEERDREEGREEESERMGETIALSRNKLRSNANKWQTFTCIIILITCCGS